MVKRKKKREKRNSLESVEQYKYSAKKQYAQCLLFERVLPVVF